MSDSRLKLEPLRDTYCEYPVIMTSETPIEAITKNKEKIIGSILFTLKRSNRKRDRIFFGNLRELITKIIDEEWRQRPIINKHRLKRLSGSISKAVNIKDVDIH